MLSELGSLLLGFSLFSMLFSGFGFFRGIRRSDQRWLKSGQRALYAGTALLLVAILLLLAARLAFQYQFAILFKTLSALGGAGRVAFILGFSTDLAGCADRAES